MTKDIDKAMQTCCLAAIWLHRSTPTSWHGQRDAPRRIEAESGYGKDMSIYALEDYTAVRTVMINHGKVEAQNSSSVSLARAMTILPAVRLQYRLGWLCR